MKEITEKLIAIGAVQAEVIEAAGEDVYLLRLREFVKSYDFLRLGQAVAGKQWQSAMMAQRRLASTAAEMGLTQMEQQLVRLRGLLARKEQSGAQNALALVIRRRVQLLNLFGMPCESREQC